MDAMKSFPSARWFHCAVCLLMLAIGFPSGCSPQVRPADLSGKLPILRILILQSQTSIKLTASANPTVRLKGFTAYRPVEIGSTPVSLTCTASGWQMGSASLGIGELSMHPASDGSVSIDGHAYRGYFRFIPRSAGEFDVVNDLDVESYLRGVLPRELFPSFADEAFKAQCVAARTYAIYEKKMRPPSADFDLYADERSMVYGGMGGETQKASLAVDATRGMVVAYGPAGEERIFKAYFSSCCGGAGQSAAEAFGDPVIPPLAAQAVGNLCSASPRFNWPMIAISKTDLTHRIQHYGQLHNNQEKDIAAVVSINVMSINAVGRPVMFTITDAKNRRFAIVGEELRRAVNTDSTPGTKLPSSDFQLDNQPKEIRFINGHGLGHGVGLCQWCAQARAEQGMGFRQILLLAYPQSTVVTAY
jgi:stage II sporulation protein D